MAIVSSTYVVGHPQIDGRRYVREVHTDSAGAEHVREYLAPVGTDYAAVANTYATVLADQLAEAEFNEALQ